MIIAAVTFTPEARDHITALYRWLATDASPEIATRYTEALLSRCEDLNLFPERGTPRDDIRPGLRMTSYRRRTIIAFTINADQVTIIGVFHGGQDYHAILDQAYPEGD